MISTATNDFSDWLNPMLVRELRQGLKTNVFVGVFVLVQVAMVLLVGFRLLSVGTEADDETGQWLDAVLWSALGLAMMIIPLRGLSSISEETKQNTLDLVHLTHLSAWRIVLGKWIALVSQVLLLAVAVLPFAVLRYFFGGVDVVGNLLTMLTMVTTSVVLCAGCILLSTMPVITRSLAVGALMFMTLSTGVGFLVRSSMGGTIYGGSGAGSVVLVYGFATVAALLFLLALAASRIATQAENYAVILRGLGLAVVGIGMSAWLAGGTRQPFWLVVSLPIGGWSIFEALTEKTSDVPSLYAPWARRGFIGRLLGRILYPGWATGLIFAFVMVSMIAALISCQPRFSASDQRDLIMTHTLIYLSAIFPLPVILLLRSLKQTGWVYTLVQMLALLVLALARMIESFHNRDHTLVAVVDALTPLSALLSFTEWNNAANNPHWLWVPRITFSLGVLALLFLAIRARREFRTIKAMEQSALQPQLAAD